MSAVGSLFALDELVRHTASHHNVLKMLVTLVGMFTDNGIKTVLHFNLARARGLRLMRHLRVSSCSRHERDYVVMFETKESSSREAIPQAKVLPIRPYECMYRIAIMQA